METGLDSRPVSETCIAGEAPVTGELALVEAWPGVNFQQPIGLVQMPGDAGNPYYVVQKGGLILRLPANLNASNASVFLDLRNVVETGGEGGALSMAFHPDYPSQPYVYVAHMVNEGGFLTRISRFTTVDGTTAGNEQVLFNLPQSLSPFGSGSIHNAGTLAFGPDGYLYMTIGDDKRTAEVGSPYQLYGSVIRIDVDGGGASGYAIPAGNAFGNEVYAYGFRNPWRLSFDRATGELWVGDVGEECYEEINLVQGGLNYGWPNWEADQCGPGSCNGENTLPQFQYHTGNSCGLGNAITGGYVYRGSINPELVGKYIYGDYQTGLVWAYDPSTGVNEDLFTSGRASGLAAFGEDNQGELFHIDIVANTVSRIERSGGGNGEGPPARLADTGCFAQVNNPLVPAPGVVPYTIAQSFWSDGAEKERFLSLPAGTTFRIDEAGDWELPVGGVLIKNFKWLGQYFETRFLVRYTDGSYGTYTYEWTSTREAVLVAAGGKDTTLSDGQTWRYPSRSECFQCHTTGAGVALGPETRQMNVDNFYPSTGRTANQFTTLDAVGMLSGNLQALEAFPARGDSALPEHEQAMAYIHINCASCHRGADGGQSVWDARFTTPFENKGLCNVAPITPVTGLPDERYIKPGDHESSTLWWRMHRRGQGQMPPLASTVIDETGAALLAGWIDALSTGECPEVAESGCNVAGNLLQNCDFSAGTSNWLLREGPGGDGSASVSNGEYNLKLNSAGTAGWHVQSIQTVGALSAGSYQVRFKARAATPRSMEVNVGEEGDDWSSLCQETVMLNPQMSEYQIDCGFIADNEGANSVKLDFNVGGDGLETVVIDDVYFGR